MRILLLGSILAVIVAVFFWKNPSPPRPSQQPSMPIPTVSPTPPENSIDIETYRVAWLAANPKDIMLLPNFSQKRTARSLIETKECTHVVNAGFYTKDNQPTGLFIANGETIRDNIPNTLLNGYFVVDQINVASIRQSPPDAPVRIGLQTGPILIHDGRPLTLSIRDDEFARRMVVGVTQKGAVVFLVVYDPDNPGSGPKLADAPDILSKVIARLQLKDALNLDGGSASAFIRGDLSLEELTRVGSFFCVIDII